MKLVYFSPTDTTRNILLKIAVQLNKPIEKEFNLTNYEFRDFLYQFNNEIILLGFPVYSGRVPETAMNRFKNISGNNSKMIICVTFGNRDYDNALMEIYELFCNNGFNIIGMCACVTQHSVVKSIGDNRPNSEDYDFLEKFCKNVDEKIKNNFQGSIECKIVKPFRKYQKIPFKPKGNKKCKECGICVKLCPENAIKNNDPRKTDKQKCITCMRCIKYCPNGSRDLTPFEKIISKKFLEKKCREYKQTIIMI